MRRIAHPKFQNINSQTAEKMLKAADTGEYVFRPSSRGQNNITLTWKFYANNIVHIDIVEYDKPIGASIGTRLNIGDEMFDNLQEIIERYIFPCNKHLSGAVEHPKFKAFDS